jgi:hypothetical protein
MSSPEIDPRYQAGEIYCICSANTPKIYIGSTFVGRKKRMSRHVSEEDCESREVMKHGNYDITRICFYPCNNKTELELEEGCWILQFREAGYQVVNKIMPGAAAAAGGTVLYKKAAYENNKKAIKERALKYYYDNKDVITEQRKNAPKFECACCGKSFSKQNLNQHHKTAKYKKYTASMV